MQPRASARSVGVLAVVALAACGKIDAPVGPVIDMDASVSPRPPSCAAGGDGAGFNCGASHADDCCASPPVEGGTFFRIYDGVTALGKNAPATVDTFRLDKYDITVGRFRQFVEAYPQSKPRAGDGAHPKIAGSGWQETWPLPADASALRNELLNPPDPAVCIPGWASWTDAVGANERMPMNCVTWFELAAFCAWDGGRLPTQAELNYAVAGGGEQRAYPWSQPPSSLTIDDSYAVFTSAPTDAFIGPQEVGSRPKGQGRWGQLDLAGNVLQWLLDSYSNTRDPPAPCDNCADLVGWANPSGGRRLKGGKWSDTPPDLLNQEFYGDTVSNAFPWTGARCARAY